MASPTVTWKRGSTFAASVAYVPGLNEPETLDGIGILTSVMDNAQRRHPLTVEVQEDLVTFLCRFDGDSSEWAAGTAAWDFQFSQGGVVYYSTTVRFIIEPQVTL
ncbi:hypothetical protein UFOVP1118_37 [uncultured Caudovirales phage]|uniref:Uncharacterized protein n=1 Tax=uncultured Caudovirales phage TaxID=2100421 RepID=A0A6J5QVT1_9CAUD|nr:hypothetical protein UFOVP1118_37 [uncultured Caudovirales phage]